MVTRIAVVAAMLLCGNACARGQATPTTLLGKWKIVKILPSHNVACWDEQRARTLVGTTLRYAPDKLAWQGGEMAISDAFRRTVSQRSFLDEYRTGLPELGIRRGTVEEIDLQHEDADFTGATTEVPGDSVLLAGPGRIVFSVCGVFYSAVRAAR